MLCDDCIWGPKEWIFDITFGIERGMCTAPIPAWANEVDDVDGESMREITKRKAQFYARGVFTECAMFKSS